MLQHVFLQKLVCIVDRPAELLSETAPEDAAEDTSQCTAGQSAKLLLKTSLRSRLGMRLSIPMSVGWYVWRARRGRTTMYHSPAENRYLGNRPVRQLVLGLRA